jgi:hypothetical protein
MRGLTNEPLFVDPALAGARLASPVRRILAFATDGLLLVIPTIVVALGATFLTLQLTQPRAIHAVIVLVKDSFSAPANAAPNDEASQRRAAARREAVRDLVPLLVQTEAAGLPAAVKLAAEEGDLNRATELMKDREIIVSLYLDEGRNESPLKPNETRLELKELMPLGVRGIALLGVPGLYFVVFTRSRRGATPGKRLFGIRVARLDGERLTWLESLERFIGYVHIPGTMFLSLVDLWRDPNRRLPHDRVVHTAVFRVRRREAFPPVQCVP